MIDLYTWPTPNGHKVHILLEELKVDYKVIPININTGDQFKKSFLKISPNNKMPAIVDKNGPSRKPISVFESGAILLYLSEKHGKFIPKNTRSKYEVIQWLMFQMASVGPMLGQAHHFRNYSPKKIPYAINRYTNEATRIYGVINRRLNKSKYIANNLYSIADMAIFPWIRSHLNQGQNLEDYPNLKKWYDKINERPATKRALEILKDKRRIGPMSKKDKEILFGKTQYIKR